MHDHHDSSTSGHLGAYCMIESFSNCYYWQGLYADCKDDYKKCLTCQASKISMQALVDQLYHLPTPTYNFEHITMDLITHSPTTDASFDSM